MNLTVNSQIFAHELRTVNKIAPAKAQMPILSHVLLTATPEDLHLYTTDLELSLRTPCLVQVREPGTLALPAARLLAMVEQFPNADVQIVKDGTGARITCGAFSSRLQALSALDFPTLPTVEGQSYTLSAVDLRCLITQTRYAIDEKGANKYVLQGALLKLSNPTAAMVTTDGKRLAISTMPHTASGVQVILPIKTLDFLAAQGDWQTVEMTVGDRHIFFTSKERLLVSRMFEGVFPNYQRIVPTGTNRDAVIDRLALAAALRRVGLVAGEDEATIFEFADGVLTLRASSAGVGESTEQIPMTYTGAPLRLCTSWISVSDVLNVALAPTLHFHLKDEQNPILILDGEQHLAVVMAMREPG